VGKVATDTAAMSARSPLMEAAECAGRQRQLAAPPRIPIHSMKSRSRPNDSCRGLSAR
jgi:hypothetical protein